jgi:hypothetical protein
MMIIKYEGQQYEIFPAVVIFAQFMGICALLGAAAVGAATMLGVL